MQRFTGRPRPASGGLRLNGRNWQVAGALALQRVHLKRINNRILVFYANTLIRKFDLAGEGSTMVASLPAKTLHL